MKKVIAMIRRLPGTTPQQFKDYYETRHVPLINRLLPFYAEYKRNYLTQDLRKDQDPFGYDVVTVLGFASGDDYEAWWKAVTTPAIAAEIGADEKNFLVSSATRMWIVEECATDFKAGRP